MTTLPQPTKSISVDPLTVQVIRDVEQWRRLQPEWDELFEASPTASAPLRFEWLWHWWRLYGPIYGDQGQGLRILTFRRQSRLIGAIPLYETVKREWGMQIRRVEFLSTGEAESEETCADYLDLLHLPEERQACVDALATALFDKEILSWDELELLDMPERSPLLSLRVKHRGCHATVTGDGTCPIADISGGLEAYLARLSTHTRKQLRRQVRGAQKAGAILERATEDADVESYFEDLIRLHQRRWTAVGQPGSFASPRFTEFHRTLARCWVPSGKAVLVRLALNGQVLAVIYGFLVGTKFDFYQSGFALDEPNGLQSPGMVAFLLLKARLAERGVTHFDFLRGTSPYKQRLATEYCPVMRLSMTRTNARMRLVTLSRLVRRAAAKGRRLFRM
ncbi:MAG TPA: GNAT family N-acetyltransferase [Tepidisphaeraceae bacterium]|nr:GNAT family N-acetyltransferase [Tepidisphaeraceae bacterium]